MRSRPYAAASRDGPCARSRTPPLVAQAATTAHSSPWWIALTSARPRRRTTPSRPAPGIRYAPFGRKSRSRIEGPKTEPVKEAGPMACPGTPRVDDAEWRWFAGPSALEEVHVDEERLRLLDLHLPALATEPDAAAPPAAEAAARDLQQPHHGETREHAARRRGDRRRQRHRLD